MKIFLEMMMTSDTGGKSRLSYVLCEIRRAQNEGLIPKSKNKTKGKLAKILASNIG